MSRSQKEVKQLVTETFKTADEIRCRLFDHQQFSHGEISFFVKEFQEKRLDSDLGRTHLDVATASVVNGNQSLNEAIDFLQSDKIEAVCSRIHDVTRFAQEEVLDTEPELLRRMQSRDEDREKRLLDRKDVFQSIVINRQKEMDDAQSKKIQDLKDKHQEIEDNMTKSFAT